MKRVEWNDGAQQPIEFEDGGQPEQPPDSMRAHFPMCATLTFETRTGKIAHASPGRTGVCLAVRPLKRFTALPYRYGV